MKRSTTKAEQPPPPTLEERLRRLDEIARLLDIGDKPLDELLAAYEEGIALADACREELERAELRVEELSSRHAVDGTSAT